MKIRSDFVSNSSSSSYIICRPTEITLKDFADKIVDWSLDREYKWLDKEYKNFKILKCKEYNDSDYVANRNNEKEHLRDIFENSVVVKCLPIYLNWSGWTKLMLNCDYTDYYNYAQGSDMNLGGHIPLEMWKAYLEKGEKFLLNFDEEYTKWVQETQGTDKFYYGGIDEASNVEDLKNDIDWIKSVINRIENDNCEFYGMRISRSGDCQTEEGIYSFEAIGLRDIPQMRKDLKVAERSESW